MITVTTADSKYSRQTDFGGPVGFVSTSGTRPWPLRLNTREKTEAFGAASLSATSVETSEVDESLITKIILDSLAAAVKFARQILSLVFSCNFVVTD